jgi:hypothetical protein
MFCFINKKLLSLTETVDDVEVFPVDFTNDLYTDLSKIGLELEKILLDRKLLWNNKPVPGVLIIWDGLDVEIKELIDITKDFRGDEMMLPDRSVINYAVGHPRAIIKWTASLHKIKTLGKLRSVMDEDSVYKKIAWWASRLELRLYRS